MRNFRVEPGKRPSVVVEAVICSQDLGSGARASINLLASWSYTHLFVRCRDAWYFASPYIEFSVQGLTRWLLCRHPQSAYLISLGMKLIVLQANPVPSMRTITFCVDCRVDGGFGAVAIL